MHLGNRPPIEQARISAKWLSNYIEKETGTAVSVQPILILPDGGESGQNSESDSDVTVMHANDLVKYLKGKSQAEKLDSVQRIIATLDKCPTVDF